MHNKHPLQTLLEDAVLEPFSYSGRGMFGRTCVAFLGRTGRNVARLLHAVQASVEEIADTHDDENNARLDGLTAAIDALGRGWTEDNMGLGYVVYFPNVPYAETYPEHECTGTEDCPVCHNGLSPEDIDATED
jgi:hypothetical protein